MTYSLIRNNTITHLTQRYSISLKSAFQFLLIESDSLPAITALNSQDLDLEIIISSMVL